MTNRVGSLKTRLPSLVLYSDDHELPSTDSAVGTPLSPSPRRTKLHQFSPREVADELCLMDAELLRRIAPTELEGEAWMKKGKLEKAPNIMSMVYASNELALLVPTEVLREPTVPAMARAIASFIKIASKLYRQNNYNSLKAILAGLQCTPIYRLKLTWREVPSKRKKEFEVLSKLMSEEHNWRAYSKHLSQLLDSTTPCIPFLGVLLTTTVQYDNSSHGRRPRRVSGVEDYTLLEAITVRNRLESMRTNSVGRRVSLPPWLETDHHDQLTVPVSPILEHITSPAVNLEDDDDESVLGTDSVILRCDSSGSSLDEDTPRSRHRLWSELSEQDSKIELTLSRSFDGLNDLFANWDLNEQHPIIRVNSCESLYSPVEPSAPSASIETDRPPSSPPAQPMRQRTSCVSREKRVSMVYSKRAPKISQCSVDIPSPVLENRRRGSTLQQVLHASSTPLELLTRYQFMSFGCSAGIQSNTVIRDIINDSVRNTEAQNYKLSYLQEPS